MVNRNKYDETISAIDEIVSHYEESGFDGSMERIRFIKEEFDIKLLVVGHFNAGKSALLNGLLGKPGFLAEAQLPQTAIATELIYDEAERAYAITDDGVREPLAPDRQYLPGQYTYLEYRMPSPGLKEVRDFTIVDTPGFDSGIEAHAKALSGYIGLGSAYLVVIDQEKGGIDRTTLKFLREITNYSSQIAVVINKCDKITDKIRDEILASAELTLQSCGFPYRVYATSKYDPDITEKLVSIVSAFNAQEAFDQNIKERMKTELSEIAKILTVIKRKTYLDTFDLDNEIRGYQRAQEKLRSAFAREKDAIPARLDETAEEIVGQIRSALVSRADSITMAILSGSQDGAEAIIVETVRPIMLHTMQEISAREIDGITSSLSFDGIVQEEDRRALSEIVRGLADDIKSLFDQGAFKMKSFRKEEITNDKDTAKEKGKTAYRAITGIFSVVTDIIAPWMEIIVILAPDIISFVQRILGGSDEERTNRLFINNVVPQICNKLFPQIRESVGTSAEAILTEYEARLNEKIEIIKENLVVAEKKRAEKKEHFDWYTRTIEEDIAQTEKLMRQLEAYHGS